MFKHHGLRQRGPMRRTAPVEGGAGGADPTAGGGGAPVVPPAPVPPAGTAPTVPDVLADPAVKAAIAKATSDAEAKARTGSKENARKEAVAEIQAAIAAALGTAPATVDPSALGAELAAARAQNNQLLRERAIGSAARVAGGDEDLVTAWLAHKNQAELKALDPAAADFATKVEALVKAQIEANPKLKAGPAAPVAPVVTPGRQGAASTGTAGGAAEGGRLSLNAALQKQMGL